MSVLYPLKFTPQIKDKIWGGSKLKNILNKQEAGEQAGESWEISSVEGNISVVSDGLLSGNNLQELIEVYMGDLVGDKVYDKFGLEFPLLIKFIDATDDLSIQVHPDDPTALERHRSYGKTEMWYVLESDPGAKLISGFNREMDKNTYLSHLEKGSLPEIMNFESAEKGDVFFMPAGRVHAIGKGILLAEIQQTSDITYRIYDWERKDSDGNSRELHTEEALDVIDFKHYDNYRTGYEAGMNEVTRLVECPYFTTNIMRFTNPVEKDFYFIDSFVVYICTEGRAVIKYNEDSTVNMVKGETVLIPAVLKNIEIIPKGECNLLEVYVGGIEDRP